VSFRIARRLNPVSHVLARLKFHLNAVAITVK
jgi:hypothetical protein